MSLLSGPGNKLIFFKNFLFSIKYEKLDAPIADPESPGEGGITNFSNVLFLKVDVSFCSLMQHHRSTRF